MLCSVCKKNLAVVFINKLDKDGKSTGETTGLCIECAKKQGIDPLANIMKEMSNMNEEDFENMSNQFDSMMGAIEGSNELGGLDDDDDLVLSEYSATIVGMEILRAKKDELEEDIRKKEVVQLAIGTLSYSELEAIEHVFEELDGKNEGLLVASKVADKVGITRSVIVNALRKFESAGVIESRSLGMKGTHIKILNEKLIDELKKIK